MLLWLTSHHLTGVVSWTRWFYYFYRRRVRSISVALRILTDWMWTVVCWYYHSVLLFTGLRVSVNLILGLVWRVIGKDYYFFARKHAIPDHLQNAQLRDIRVITTLGVGGFGRVELVRCCLIYLNIPRANQWSTSSGRITQWCAFSLMWWLHGRQYV